MTFIHERADWPRFRWNDAALSSKLAGVRHRQGRLVGRMEDLGFSARNEAVLRTLTQDVVKSSAIEGEHLDDAQVRSSIARRLGLDVGAVAPADRGVEGVVEMMLSATQRYSEPLTAERLFSWHAALFPTGRSGLRRIIVGAWRDDATGPMQVVSGPLGRERVHFQAPPAARLDAEVDRFLSFFESSTDLDSVLLAGMAHLWFLTLHPFDDGNGRIARAIADMALARSEASPQRFYSVSSQIRLERSAYYEKLEAAQRGTLDITAWLDFFLECVDRAVGGAASVLGSVLKTARFWELHRDAPRNERQRAVLNRLLGDFVGKLTTSKYAALAHCSQDTALRDICELVDRGALRKDGGGGRSTSYSLVEV